MSKRPLINNTKICFLLKTLKKHELYYTYMQLQMEVFAISFNLDNYNYPRAYPYPIAQQFRPSSNCRNSAQLPIASILHIS